MAPILGFKTFTTEDEFAEWQRHAKRDVYQIAPMVMNVSGGADESGTIQAKTVIGCFVTYKLADA